MNGIDPHKRYHVSGDILAKLISYLQSRPYGEVAQGINALGADIVELAAPPTPDTAEGATDGKV